MSEPVLEALQRQFDKAVAAPLLGKAGELETWGRIVMALLRDTENRLKRLEGGQE